MRLTRLVLLWGLVLWPTIAAADSVDAVREALSGDDRGDPMSLSLPQDLNRMDAKLLPALELPPVDLEHELLRDEERAGQGRVAHYAAALKVNAGPWDEGHWQALTRGQARWLLRVHSPGALSLSLAFSDFQLPPGAELRLMDGSGKVLAGPFTAADNEEHGQLWSPPLITDDLLVALDIPIRRLDDLKLTLSRVHHGYAGFGRAPAEKSGSCQQDLVCDADSRRQVLGRAVGLVAVEGVRYCTGFLINNTAQDAKPYFITAGHCGINSVNAPSVVVMWEHAVTDCSPGAEAPLPYRSFQTGSMLRAEHGATDLVLLELDDPTNTEHGAYYAGWDRSFDTPREGLSIHHPNTDRRRVATTRKPIAAADHLSRLDRPRGNHLRVGSWNLGTTEGGSSGAPLFNEDLRVVGALHGGYAACGNRESDWFGRLATAWDNGNQPSRRFRDWLDPLGTGAVVLDGLVGQ